MDNTFDSEYSIQREILNEIGGDSTQRYDSPYEVQLAILQAIQGGAGGGAIDDNNTSTGTTWSSSKITSELANAGFDTSIVSGDLPATGDIHTIYFKASTDPQTLNTYDEFMYIGNAWEQVGSTAIDLSNYATLNDISTFITADDVSIYAEKTYVDASLNAKANTSYVDTNFAKLVSLTQAEYDALVQGGTVDSSTLYVIVQAQA